MANPPQLLNDDGSASMATMFMMSHHGFRRDLRAFVRALSEPSVGEAAAEALREEWKNFCATLHGHHHIEDTSMFPGMKANNPPLASFFDDLGADHRQIDPLLERGSAAFAELPNTAAARAVVTELLALLDPHLAKEEANLVPLLRSFRAFPPLGSDAEANMFAQGFAWSSHGIAEDVLEQVGTLLPQALTSRLPEARKAFEARCVRVWGTAQIGSSRTPIPID
jgi:hemerythrin-like domain-containing protein